ncbi:DUF4911 domain-containing protein [Pseudodesulfovibrio sp.]|uniref:DUF4911 domain-containing protein n=1 Tax=unclassified Pseudodesulfovibrio TaxID=2661612 RepID=UPI003B002B74
MASPSRRRPRKRILPPPPAQSARLYVRVDPSDIARFRFLLEGHDNLGLFTVVNKFDGVLLLRFSPHQRREMDRFLVQAGEMMQVERVYKPGD